jgi:prolyl-tRNA synthetase
MFIAYLRTFARMGLKSIPMAADTGPIGGDLSHGHHPGGDRGKPGLLPRRPRRDAPAADVDFGRTYPLIKQWTQAYAATDEKHDAARFEAEVPADKRVSARGIEVGHIFFFGTKYSEPMGCRVQGPDGSMIAVQMGSYGVGVSRLVGAIVEASHDEAGIVWPVPVAPFEVGLVNLKAGDKDTDKACADLYAKLEQAGDLGPLRRHGGARWRQVRDHGPDRPAVPADRRAQGPEEAARSRSRSAVGRAHDAWRPMRR